MSPPGELRESGFRRTGWHVLLVASILFALTVSLATRTFRLTVPDRVNVHTGSAQAVRQHMDRDAIRWSLPAPILTALKAPTSYPYVAPAGPPLPSVLFDKSLYTRPPPSF